MAGESGAELTCHPDASRSHVPSGGEGSGGWRRGPNGTRRSETGRCSGRESLQAHVLLW